MFKRIICVLLSFVLLFNVVYVYAEDDVTNTGLQVTSKEACLMESESGKILYEKDSDKRVSPASITKIMTLLLIYESLEDGKIKKEDMVTTSAHAKSMGGSQVFLEEGEQQSVETMIKCIVIASGNDASVAMAEHISGSEEAFVAKMNEKAKELGMNNTNFEDCCGLTDSDNHYSCAKDVAIMSRELVSKYPDVLNYSSIWMENIIHKTNKGESEFVLSNTNKLLKTNEYVKGLKTGSTSKAKYCVSIVGIKDEVCMISVIMGAPDYKVRFSEANELLNYGFANCVKYTDKAKDNKYLVNVKGGVEDSINSGYTKDFCYVSTDKDSISKIKKSVNKNKVTAPVKKGDKVGEVIYSIDGKEVGREPIVSFENIDKASFMDEIKNIFMQMMSMI